MSGDPASLWWFCRSHWRDVDRRPSPPASTPPPATAPARLRPHAIPDHTSLFPDAGKVSAVVVPDHLLGMQKMPGGSLAEYDVKKGKEIFDVCHRCRFKSDGRVSDAGYEGRDGEGSPSIFRGWAEYFGTYGDKPLYCFAKLHYLAGIVGLSKDAADPIARNLAAQLH